MLSLLNLASSSILIMSIVTLAYISWFGPILENSVSRVDYIGRAETTVASNVISANCRSGT